MTLPAEAIDRPSIAVLQLGRPFDPRRTAIAALAAGVVIGLAVAYLIVSGETQLAIGAAVALPMVALVVRDPFIGVILWLITLPYFLQLSAETGPVVWALHRLGIPLLMVLTAVHGRLGWRRWGLRLGWIDLLVAAFIAIGLLNVIFFAPNVPRMIASFYDKLIIPIGIFWLVRALSPRAREIGLLVWAGLFTVVVQSTIGIMSWVAPSVLPAAWLGRAGERTTGTLGGPAPYTITLVLFVLLALHAAAQNPSIARRAGTIAIAILGVVAIFLSLSRGSWLGAGLAIGGLMLLYRRMLWTVGLVGLVAFAALSVGPLAEQVAFAQDRLADADTVESRLITNDAALRMIESRPVTGFGFGNFEHFDESFKRRVGDIPLKLGGSAHNTYLNMFAELGVPATILYLGAPFLLLVMTIQRWRRLPRSGLMGRSLVVVLWLAFIDQVAVLNFLEMIHPYFWATSLWWLILGLIAATLDRAVPARGGEQPGAPRA